MNTNGCLQMLDSSLTDILLRIDQGSVFVEVLEKHKNSRIRIQTGTAEIELKKVGLYRLDSQSNRFYVFDGKAEILNNLEKATLKKGRSAVLSSDLKTYKFNMDQSDSFHEWVQRRSFVVYSRIKFARRREFMAQQMSGRRLLMEMDSFARQQMQLQQQQQWIESLQQRAPQGP